MPSATNKASRLNLGGVRFRLTALFVGIFGATLILFSATLYSAFLRNERSEFDVALYNHAVDISQSIAFDVFGRITINTDLLSTEGKIIPFSPGKMFLQIVSLDRRVLARSNTLGKSQLPLFENDFATLLEKGAAFRNVSRKSDSYRMISYLVRDNAAGPFILQVAVPTLLPDQTIRGLLTFLLISVPLVLILATFGGLYLSHRALLPVKQAFESQERFIADASHELKTPLAILRGEVDLLKSRARSPEEIAEFTRSASEELDYLCRIVEDLLILARMDAGAASLSLEKLRLDELAIDLVARLEPLAKAKQVRISLNLDTEKGSETEDLFSISGDPDLLRSMLKNLIENAIKFSPPQSTIQLSLEDTSPAPAEVVVRVADQGPGIPRESLGRIFDRFFRVEQVKTTSTGAGLGLAIARRIAEAHRGSIEVESTPGSGTTFTVRIKKF